MLTYTPNRPRNTAAQREYPWALLLLAFIWLWPGVFSHDLWKPAEPKTYAVISEAAQHSAWLPTLFGQPDFNIAPLYVQTALWFRHVLSPWAADAFSASRLASVLFAGIGLLGCGMAGFRFLGRHHGRSVVLILLGSVGLLPLGHFLGVQSMVFAGVGLALWAFSVAHRQVVFATLLAGTGMLLLMQSAGLLFAVAVWFSGWLLRVHPKWRDTRFLMSLLGMAAVAAPLCAVYPAALRLLHPELFYVYVQHHIFGIFGGTRDFQAAFSLFYYAKHLLWFAFPALPLAVWTFSRGKVLQSDWGAFVCVWLVVFGTLLALSPVHNQDWLVLVLPVLALAGAAQLDNLRSGATAFLNWFGIMTFGCAAAFLWVGFIAMNYGFPAKLAERAAYFSPYYTRDINIMPLVSALVFTPMWFIAINRKNIRGRQAVTNWAAGTTLVWALLMTLFLPWIDAAKSYRPVVQEMQNALSATERQDLQAGRSCLFIAPQFAEARLAWQQYSTLPYSLQNESCRYALVQYNPKTADAPTGNIVWHGRRPRNKTEHFVLLDKQP